MNVLTDTRLANTITQDMLGRLDLLHGARRHRRPERRRARGGERRGAGARSSVRARLTRVDRARVSSAHSTRSRLVSRHRRPRRRPLLHAQRGRTPPSVRKVTLPTAGPAGRITAMSARTTDPFPAVERRLRALGGERVRLARLRRRITATLLAERAGMSRPTLRAIERGDPGVTLGSIANVLHSLGLDADLDLVAAEDRTSNGGRSSTREPTATRSPVAPSAPLGPLEPSTNKLINRLATFVSA